MKYPKTFKNKKTTIPRVVGNVRRFSDRDYKVTNKGWVRL